MAEKNTKQPPEGTNNTSEDVAKKPASFLGKVKENSLNAAGMSYMVADASLMVSGLLSKRYSELATGAIYLGAGGILARYGKLDGERELRRLNTRLGEYLKEEGVELPEHGDISADALAKQGGVVEKIEDFLYKNPSQVLNAIYAFGGAQLAKSGLQHGKPLDLMAGSFVTAGALSGLLLPEAKEKSEHTGNPITDTANWFKEKPLRIAGGFYMLNNFALIGAALRERKASPEQKSYMFKLLTASIFMVANTLLSLSSKDAHSGDGSEIDTSALYKGAATLIAKQPPEIQHDLIQRVSGYLSTENTVDMTSDEIAQKLTDAIDAHKPHKHSNKNTDEPEQKSWLERTNLSKPEAGLSKA